jgi:hypothetical protein
MAGSKKGNKMKSNASAQHATRGQYDALSSPDRKKELLEEEEERDVLSPMKSFSSPASKASMNSVSSSPMSFPDLTPRTARSLSTIWESANVPLPTSLRRLSQQIQPKIKEASTVVDLTLKLIRFLGFGWKWIIMLIRLLLFALPLSYCW